MTLLRIEYDTALWVPVPARFPSDNDADVASWSARAAAERRRLGWSEEEISGTLEDFFTRLADVAVAQQGNGDLYLLVADDVGSALVLVDIRPEHGSEQDLLDSLGARDSDAYDPPQVEAVSARHLGEGARVLRYATDLSDSVTGVLSYGFRCSGSDVVVWTQSDNLPKLDRAMPYLADLLDRMSPVDDIDPSPDRG